MKMVSHSMSFCPNVIDFLILLARARMIYHISQIIPALRPHICDVLGDSSEQDSHADSSTTSDALGHDLESGLKGT